MTTLKERLAKQREAVAATGAGADDVIRQRVVPLEAAKPVEVTPPASVLLEAEPANTLQAASTNEVTRSAELAASADIPGSLIDIPSPVAVASSPIIVAADTTQTPIAVAPTPVDVVSSHPALVPDPVGPIATTVEPRPVAGIPDTALPSMITAPAIAPTPMPSPVVTTTDPVPRPITVVEPPFDDYPEVEGTRTQGIPISASDDAIITAMEAHCRRHRIKVRRNSNVSLITRAGWRLLYDLMQRDPQAFAAAIEAGRPPRRLAN